MCNMQGSYSDTENTQVQDEEVDKQTGCVLWCNEASKRAFRYAQFVSEEMVEVVMRAELNEQARQVPETQAYVLSLCTTIKRKLCLG